MAVWIDRTETLPDFRSAPAVVGLDTEFMRIDTFAPKLALIQIELDGQVGLIDPLAELDLGAFATHLGAVGTITIMHSASEDLDALASVLPQGLGTLFDTQIAAAFVGLGPGLGYQKLVATLCGVELGKGETRSDWLRRPLSPGQLEYAALDVVYLPALHAELDARLHARGFRAWHAEECTRMLERARNRTPDLQPQIAYRGAADWKRESQALLRRLLIWRDATARRIDRPRPWLLDDARLLGLSANPPATLNALAEATRGQRALRTNVRTELFDLIQRPLAADELDFAPIPPAADANERRVVRALKEIVERHARNLDIPEGLLCARRHLETLHQTRQWPTALEGWRRGILHDDLMQALPDA